MVVAAVVAVALAVVAVALAVEAVAVVAVALAVVTGGGGAPSHAATNSRHANPLVNEENGMGVA